MRGILSSVSGALFLVLCVSSFGATFHVPAGDVAGLISAINTSNSNGQGNEIVLGVGTPFTLTAVNNVTNGENGLPSITSRMTIRGDGGRAIVERGAAAPLFRIFHVVAPGMLTLMDLTVRNGHIRGADGVPAGLDARGGGLYSDHGYVSISSCTFSGNTATGGDAVSNNPVNCTGGNGVGGAIYGVGGNINAWTCTFETNRAIGGNASAPTGSANSRTGGAALGGAVYMESGGPNDGVWANRSRFMSNSASGGNATNAVGAAVAGAAFGGAVRTLNPGNLSLEQVVVAYCGAEGGLAGATRGLGWGGGASHEGTGSAMITNVTFSGNAASASGGGIHLNPTGTTSVRHCTITTNVADHFTDGTGDGGGIFLAAGGAATVTACIVAQNTDEGGQAPDSAGPFTSGGYNLIGNGMGVTGFVQGVNNDIVGTGLVPIDPLLGPLALNGGDTETRAVLVGSPALDYIPQGACTWYNDQRGVSRPQNNACEIGAYEKAYFIAQNVSTSMPNPTNSTTLWFMVGFNDIAVNFSDVSDLIVTTTGTLAYTSVTGFMGGMNFGVQFDGVTGDGTISIAVSTLSDVQNPYGDPLVWSMTSAPLTVDTPPALSISPPSLNSTTTGPVSYTITYIGASDIFLAPGDITLETTGSANGTVSVTGSGNIARTVTISGITGTGAIRILRIAANSATDATGNMAPQAGPSIAFWAFTVSPIPLVGTTGLAVLGGLIALCAAVHRRKGRR